MARRTKLAAALGATPSTGSSFVTKADARDAAVAAKRDAGVALREDVRAVLPGREPAEIEAIARDLGRVGDLARSIRSGMVDMGRALLRLQEAAGDGGYRALQEAGLVPVSEGHASKLRAIAAAVDGRRLPLDRLPRAVEAAYVAARLAAPVVERLLSAEVLRPEATVRELREAARPPAKVEGDELSTRERRVLERRRDRLLAEVARIETRLAAGLGQ